MFSDEKIEEELKSKTNDLILDEDSNILLKSVDELNKNSNEAAISLEQMALSLEQISSNITQLIDLIRDRNIKQKNNEGR